MRVLDLFSGIGGFSLGLERAGHKTVAFCEFDKKAQLVLKKHWPNLPIYDDVRTLTKETLHNDGIKQIDIICGGFPCQDISLAGKGAGLAGERSGLWFEFHRLIKEIQPQYAIIENVAALRSRGLDQVLRSLAEIGYDAEWHCIPASAVGAPHRRDRVWIVANTNRYANTAAINRSHFAESGKAISNWKDDLPTWNATRAGDVIGGNSLHGHSISDDATNTVREGLEGQWTLTSRISEELENARNSRWWAVEPNVCRVAHGVSGRVDRLKQLGNAVVPQIPELIGRALL